MAQAIPQYNTTKSDSRGLSVTFKKNLGTILARIQKQHELEAAHADSSAVDSQAHVEALLGDVDRIISDQKQLSDLIQNVKAHQKVVKELETVEEATKAVQESILVFVQDLQTREQRLLQRLDKARTLQESIHTLQAVITDPEGAILAAQNLALTTTAPPGWQPPQPLQARRPPYPTEDLIRRSALYALMFTQGRFEEEKPSIQLAEEPISSSQATLPSRSLRTSSRGRGLKEDKAKLLDLDLNPDL